MHFGLAIWKASVLAGKQNENQHHTQGIYVNQTKTYGGNSSAQKNYQAWAESDHVERTQNSARVTLQVLYDL
jgi:hypothetical protein